MKVLKRVGIFMWKLLSTWSGKITGSFTAFFAAWQYTGHTISPRYGWAIIMAGIVIASFEVWNRQVNETDQAKSELAEYKQRNSNPIVELQFFHKLETREDLEFHLASGLTAYNVQIQPIVMPKSTAKFPEVTKIPIGERKIIKPVIEPVVDTMYRHDFIVMLHNQPEEYIEAHRTDESRDLPEPVVAIPIEITYSNQTGREWFITRMEILYDFNPFRKYVDTRLVETGSLPSKPQKQLSRKMEA